ncbi:hypothetical protein SH580_17090 [Coraliomargarita algicola]|uniref:Uncharacterized protein n=1 Tax=Coraliomargarita algicola TaxID=3092156 RepID=A0ABZ0RHZ8_9BACT|nr:hypothetical protein [Coraliomargarita sp. J2-16]WPJ95142.1 hypothetical protein SH580_17090 [Coraliomargarita sp. J2-16]
MKQIILHTFTKAEVEALDFKRFDALFGHWPQLWNHELRDKFDSLVFMVDGYNDRTEEIYCIPEVRRFYRELHRRWPWWTFFLCNENASMAVAYLCLIDEVGTYKRDTNPMCAASFDPRLILEILHHDFGRMNYLWSIARMSDEANDQRSDDILKLFKGGVSHE